jgi:hypothetical protein
MNENEKKITPILLYTVLLLDGAIWSIPNIKKGYCEGIVQTTSYNYFILLLRNLYCKYKL